MADNISNEYNMIKILQDIGTNFFSSELSQQRVGMFGFTCEAMARMFGAVILDSNMRANEYHIVTAKKMDTLLYNASVLGVEIESTNPAEMVAYLAFDVSQIHRTEFSNPNDENSDYKTYYFIIERDTNINIAGYNFMLEWDILVTATHNDKEYVYSARYLTEGDADPHNNDMCKDRVYIKEDTLSELKDKYIQGNLVTAGSQTVFMMKVNLRQMEKTYEYHTVTENDMISLTGLEFQYDDFLSHFNVYFRENQSSEWEYVLPVSIYDTSEYIEKTVQYQVDKDSKVIIINATQFEMKFNSELRIDIYTTKGANGNLTYNGDGSDIVCELRSYDDKHIYNGIDLACVPITPAQFGRDTEDIEEVRAKVIRANASRNALSTEYDLYNFMKERDLINDYFFIKKRSDILDHIYGTFTILRTESGDIIPSTTLNFIIKKEDDERNGVHLVRMDMNTDDESDDKVLISIKAGTPFRLVRPSTDFPDPDSDPIDTNCGCEDCTCDCHTTYPQNNGVYYEGDDELIDIAVNTFDIDEDNSKFLSTVFDRITTDENGNEISLTNSQIAEKEKTMKLFALPYTILYDSNNQLASLYLTSISRNVDMSWVNRDINSSDILKGVSNFAVDHISISRNSFVGEDYYHINVAVMPNGDYSNAVSDDYVNSGAVMEHALMVKGFVYNKNQTDLTSDTGKEQPYAFFDFDFKSFSEGIFEFETDIKINDSLSITDTSVKTSCVNFMYELNNIITVTDDSEQGTEKISNIIPNSTTPIDVFNLKIGVGIYYLSDRVEQTYVPEYVDIEDSYPTFRNGDVDYVMTDLYTNSSDLINLYTDMSYVIRSTTDELDDYIIFRDLPLLQYSKAIDDTISNRVANIISNTKVYLDEINTRLDDSFSIDYKFFRTYGPCQYFKLEKASSTEQQVLNSLDISLELNARLKSGITATDSDITTRLKSFLKTYVEKLNDEDDDYTIYMSNITTELEKNFSDILKSIDLVDLNGTGDKYRVILYDKPVLESYQAQVNGRQLIKNYVPEYLNLPLENITINIIR